MYIEEYRPKYGKIPYTKTGTTNETVNGRQPEIEIWRKKKPQKGLLRKNCKHQVLQKNFFYNKSK